MSQIGYMMLGAGLGVAGYAFAIFHLLNHGFFKANMFLGAGSVMHGMDDDVDMRHYGALRKAMPVTFLTFTMGYLAIIGVPPFSGFWSKDKIIETALADSWVVGLLAVLGAGITGFYMTRLMLMTFFGEKRWEDGVHPHESPKVMTIPLIVLAALSALGGLMLLNDWIVDFLAPVTGTAEHVEPPIPAWSVSVLVLAVVAVGVAIAWYLVGKREVPRTAPTDVSFATRAARADLYGDAINDTLVVAPGCGPRPQPHVLRPARCRRRGRGRVEGHRRDRHDPAAHAERLRPVLRTLAARRRSPRRPRAPGGELLMNDFPWLTALIVVPLVGAVVTAALPYEGDKSQPKKIALGFSVLTLVLAAVMATQYDADGGFQFTETHEWINVFGAHYALGVDGMALVLVLLTTLLVPVVIGASWFDADHGNTKAFFAWALALEARRWACSWRRTSSSSTCSSRPRWSRGTS